MAATQGHTQSLHTNALDEALGLPTDFSARIARNTQLFLQQESGTDAGDRSVGRQLLRRAAHRRAGPAGRWRTSHEIEGLGGMTKAIEAGIPKLRIEEAAATHPGADRLRAPGRRRRQPLPARARHAGQRAEDRQLRGARGADRQARAAARRARRRPRSDARSSALTECAPSRRRATCSSSPSRRPARTLPSARSRDALEKVYGRHAAEIRSIAGVYRAAKSETFSMPFTRTRELVEALRASRGPAPAHPGGQDGPGRPRPRPEGDRHRRSPTSASTSTSARCSRPPRRSPARRSRPTCTSSAPARWPPAT